MKLHKQLAGFVIGLLLIATPALAKHKGKGDGNGCDCCYSGPYPTVDVCAGGDFVHQFGGPDTPAYTTDVLTISQQGTYTSSFEGFGCTNDNASTLLGNVSIVDEAYSAPSFIAERTFFNFTSGPNQGQIVVSSDVPSGLAGDGCGQQPVDVPITGGSGAFAGITGVAHISSLNNESICLVQFAPK